MNGLNGNNKPNGMHIGVKSSPVHCICHDDADRVLYNHEKLIAESKGKDMKEPSRV